ncbi:MAG: hypothetical protein K0U20_08590 [Proteobacteria bacterium]|nr:hypothetical protein [Pseudomonadota bacterium]
MNTIINKKGNKGFTISGWNFSFSNTYYDRDTKKYDANGVSCDLIGRKEIKNELVVIIRPVTVHSCGKKELKLFSDDTNSLMRGSNYSPDTAIYETAEDAKEWFNNAWSEWMREHIINDAQRQIDRLNDDYHAKFKWQPAALEQAIEAKRRFENGEIPVRISTFIDETAKF